MRAPANPLGRAMDAAAHGPELIRRLTTLLPRVVSLLDTADRIVLRVEALLDRLERCETQVQAVIRHVASSERSARAVVDDAVELERRARQLFEGYEPVLRDSLATMTYAGERIGAGQVDALVAYLDFLPMLQTIDRELVPTLGTLQSVAPDLTELLAVSRGLNELMGSLPGLGRAKKRMDDELAKADEA